MFENILIHIYSIDLKIILLEKFIVILIIISFTIFYFKTAKNLRSIRNLIIQSLNFFLSKNIIN